MKKIRTLMLTALALIMGAMTAFASPENPTNEEVMTALTRATTVFEWFEHNPLPTDGKERFDSGYMLYYSVSDPTIHNMLDLKAAVHDIFTDSLASFIISAGTRLLGEQFTVRGVRHVAVSVFPLPNTLAMVSLNASLIEPCRPRSCSCSPPSRRRGSGAL